MFGWSKGQKERVVVIRDSRGVASSLRQAFEAADEGERAGLQRALTIVEQTTGLSDIQVRRRWVREILDREGVDPAADGVAAVKTLRQKVPGLSLLTAHQWVEDVAKGPA